MKLIKFNLIARNAYYYIFGYIPRKRLLKLKDIGRELIGSGLYEVEGQRERSVVIKVDGHELTLHNQLTQENQDHVRRCPDGHADIT